MFMVKERKKNPFLLFSEYPFQNLPQHLHCPVQWSSKPRSFILKANLLIVMKRMELMKYSMTFLKPNWYYFLGSSENLMDLTLCAKICSQSQKYFL